MKQHQQQNILQVIINKKEYYFILSGKDAYATVLQGHLK